VSTSVRRSRGWSSTAVAPCESPSKSRNIGRTVGKASRESARTR
jgi:hypothetical protein